MNKHKMHRLCRIDAQRATFNLNKLDKTKDTKLFMIMEKAREKFFRKNMCMFY